jgi:hypothetical protein
MSDDKEPTPEELALKQIFPSPNQIDMAAYAIAGGALGVHALQQQVAAASSPTPPAADVQPPADDAPPIFRETGPRSGSLDSTAYLAQRARLFDEYDDRRGKK